MKRHYWLLVSLIFSLSTAVQGENWPGWRGPRGDGSSDESDLPITWSDSDNVIWKIELNYGGHSSPIVWNNIVFITGADTDTKKRVLVAIDRTRGKTIWNVTVDDSPLEKKHTLNSWASSTPATDGQSVFVSFLHEKEMLVAAYDLTGQELWKVRPGVFSSVHGYCSSPILFDNLVIINGDHDGDAYLVALERTTGKTVWKTVRANRTRSYCTPLIREIDGRMQMMLSGSKSIASFDPRTGNQHWIIDGPTEQFVASPVYHKDLIYVTGGFPDKHIMAIDPRGTGNLTKSVNIKWHRQRNGVSYVPSPVATNGLFFIVADDGIATCIDCVSGEQKWQKRLGRRFSASLMTAADRVYYLDDDGNSKVLKATSEYQELADNKLGEATYASMAASSGQLLIRGEKHLFCIGNK